MKRISLSLVLFFLAVFSSSAQKYALEVKSDSKVLHVSELGLAPSTTVYEALKTLPELLSRKGTYLITNYSVTINEMPIGDMNDAILNQLRISEVATIVIKESASSTYTYKGESGSIDITLKDPDRDFSGSVALDVSYPTDIVPGAMLSYKKDKWHLTTLVKGDYYDPSPTKVEVRTDYGVPTISYDSDLRYSAQTAFLLAERKGKKDELTLSFAENTTSTYTLENGVESLDDSFYLTGHAKYERSFNNGSSFSIAGDYSYTKAHSAALSLLYTLPFYKKDKYTAALCTGLYSSYGYFATGGVTSSFAMPFVICKGVMGAWSWSVELDGQYLEYQTDAKAKDNHFDFTGLASLGWQFTDHQKLRLFADRKIIRQNSLTLNPVKVNSVNLDYIIDGKLDDGRWMINAGGGYIRVSDVFATTTKPYDANDIFNLDFLARISKGVLTLSLSGNLYDSYLKDEGADAGHGMYYNVSFMPSLNFKNGMHVTSAFVYNSKVTRSFQEHGAVGYTHWVVGKNWNRFNAHIFGILNLLGDTTDMEYKVPGNVYTTYSLVRNTIGVGVSYIF